MNKFLTLILIILPLNIYGSEISVDSPIIKFDKNENSSRSLTVRNHSNFVGYVKAELYEIINSGMKNEKKILYKQTEETDNEEIKSPELAGVYFSPSKMVLEKTGSYADNQVIRIINMNENLDKERVYRLRVYPVIQGFEAGEKKIGVKILMGYESLIFVQPDNPLFKYTYNFTDNRTLVIKNEGNINIKFSSGEHCSKQKKCKKLSAFRLYENNIETIKLPFDDGTISFELTFGNERKILRLNNG